MKKIFTLIGLITITLTAISQHSIFTIFSDAGEKFTLYVDGQKINNSPETRVSDIKYKNEMSNIKVVLEDDKSTTIKKNIALKDVDGNYQKFVFIIKNKKGKYKIKVNSFQTYTPTEETSNSELSGYEETYTEDKSSSESESPENVSMTITTSGEPENGNNGNANISMNINANENDDVNSANISMNISEDGENASINISATSDENNQTGNVNINMNVSGAQTTTTRTESTTYTSHSSGTPQKANLSSSNNIGGCSSPVSASEFSEIKESIQSNDFEDTKLTVAKDIAKNKCLSSQQVHDIMKLFTFEDNRISFAAFAYDYVYDKDNYYKTYKAFEYESSVDDLKEKID